MKKYLILFFLVHATIITLIAQNNFFKSFNLFFQLSDVIKTSDNGFAFITWKGNILKIDSSTQLKFYKELLCDTFLGFKNITQTTDSGIIISSISNPYNTNGIGCIVKFDKKGNYLWSKRYYNPTTSTNQIYDIKSAGNNEFYMLSTGCALYTLIKCDENGDIIWQKRWSPTFAAEKLLQLTSNKLLIIGAFNVSGNDSLRKIYISMVDTTGNVIWFKEYDNNGDNFIVDAIKDSNNGFSVLINLQKNNSTVIGMKNAIIHFDSLGNILSAKKIFTNELVKYTMMFSFAKTNTNGYLCTGQLVFANQETSVIYFKTDSLDNLIWTRFLKSQTGKKVFLMNNNYIFSEGSYNLSIAKLDENGFGFCNFDSILYTVESLTYNITELPVLTMNADFLSESNSFIFKDTVIDSFVYCTNSNLIDKHEINNDYLYYPNPSTNNLTVEGECIKRIEILNLNGEKINEVQSSDTKIILMDISEIPNGFYFLRLLTCQGIFVKKIVIIR